MTSSEFQDKFILLQLYEACQITTIRSSDRMTNDDWNNAGRVWVRLLLELLGLDSFRLLDFDRIMHSQLPFSARKLAILYRLVFQILFYSLDVFWRISLKFHLSPLIISITSTCSIMQIVLRLILTRICSFINLFIAMFILAFSDG